ncbi:MAG: T9SS type A sorting domain-containing protein [Flavobacteriales bacterium]
MMNAVLHASAFLLVCLGTLFHAQAQTYTLTVINGHGGGSYGTGDTVHVWSEAYDDSRTFSQWTGAVEHLARPKEWHTTLVMPAEDISITAEIVDMPPYTITLEQIMGANIMKNVYHFFPDEPKGVIHLFHGTNGSAAGWIDKEENRSFVNAAIADTFGIIVTEAEEISLGIDLNGDGKLRWKPFPADTVNGVDYRNLRALTDTFITRGYFTSATPRFSVGMSNGGSFSAAFSTVNDIAGVSYCASSAMPVFEQRFSPFAFRMARFDDNEEVGPEGNQEALQYDGILQTRGICHDYELNDRQPIYPQRFERITGISSAQSQAIFNELVVNGQLDALNYALNANLVMANVQAAPANYPTILSFPVAVQLDILGQVAVSNAEHNFYSDLNRETLDFFNTLCALITLVTSDDAPEPLALYPNPVRSALVIDLPMEPHTITVFDALGHALETHSSVSGTTTLSTEHLAPGSYFLRVVNSNSTRTARFLRQ